MKKLHKIDTEGILIFGDDLYIAKNEQVPNGYTDVLLPNNEPFYRPCLIDGVWVETKPQEEIEAEHLLVSLQPTPQELADADLEIKMLTLLMEMEVI